MASIKEYFDNLKLIPDRLDEVEQDALETKNEISVINALKEVIGDKINHVDKEAIDDAFSRVSFEVLDIDEKQREEIQNRISSSLGLNQEKTREVDLEAFSNKLQKESELQRDFVSGGFEPNQSWDAIKEQAFSGRGVNEPNAVLASETFEFAKYVSILNENHESLSGCIRTYSNISNLFGDIQSVDISIASKAVAFYCVETSSDISHALDVLQDKLNIEDLKSVLEQNMESIKQELIECGYTEERVERLINDADTARGLDDDY